jgi:uncharacterized protein (DUF924 family)
MAEAPLATPAQVLDFWFGAGPQKWFSRDAAFDAAITERFMPSYDAAAAGKFADWEKTAEGALALLLLLDQFPRNMFRASVRAFATDPAALAIAKRAVAHGFDRDLDLPMRNFFYMPFMHSENPADQERCVELSRLYSDANTLKWAELHADIIRRFGRFPHRNVLLGRATTPEEQAFLDAGGFAG